MLGFMGVGLFCRALWLSGFGVQGFRVGTCSTGRESQIR